MVLRHASRLNEEHFGALEQSALATVAATMDSEDIRSSKLPDALAMERLQTWGK